MHQEARRGQEDETKRDREEGQQATAEKLKRQALMSALLESDSDNESSSSD